jgi:ornithine cyclodeaminase
VATAEIICTTTSAKTPIIKGEWLAKGAHINAVGACVPKAREFDGDAMARSSLYTDRLESLHKEAGDFLLAKEDAVITDDHIRGEIGDLLSGKIDGRTGPGEITFFKSLGIGVEDLAAANFIYEQARQKGIGSFLEFSEAPDGED